MEPQRPLVWLSAAPDTEMQATLRLPGWQQVRICAQQTPIFPAAECIGKPVGVCVLSELDATGLDNLRAWLEILPVTSWLALVTRRQLENTEVCRLIREYCQDYHTLPLDSRRLLNSLGHMWGMQALGATMTDPERISYQDYVLDGPSSHIRQARSLLRRFAATHEPVLIYGANGTGKEAAARFIHEHSPRQHGPFVVINCAALPESLTQSELFGHERGAFTHALKARKGRIEAADRGTLVLAGADELGPTQQSAILRFLEEGTIEPVGSNQPVKLDVRVVAISGTPLDEQVAQGHFRSDVFYRLGNLTVTLPTLRERLEDLPYLARRVLEASGGGHYKLGNATLLAMAAHPWPGNLRELQNRLRQAVLLARQLQLEPEDLGLAPTSTPARAQRFSLEAYRARADQEAISTSLALTHQNISAAARLLNISRVSFYRLIEKHHLQLPSSHIAPNNQDQGDLP
ncbi:sigma-54-dependent transcriptional regulator [Marinobacter sp. VGCF2001]|uniref:sigma-54-dependent transcriptional regulator n=1 Tax=Marinobacter sp. VGCF2001 TaxID=3417189 RepID=UPI003CF07627